MEQLGDIDVQELYGEKEMWDLMEELMGRLRSLLLKADRRLRE
jgi:hypothetical protein